MEHMIGEILTLSDGRKAEVSCGIDRWETCLGCAYYDEDMNCIPLRKNGLLEDCCGIRRTDHKNIIFKEIKEE